MAYCNTLEVFLQVELRTNRSGYWRQKWRTKSIESLVCCAQELELNPENHRKILVELQQEGDIIIYGPYMCLYAF